MKKEKLYLNPELSPEELTEVARKMNQLRWKGVPSAKRREHCRKIAIHPGVARCPCGNMTLKRAETRADKQGKGLGHKPECTFYRRQRRPGKRKPGTRPPVAP